MFMGTHSCQLVSNQRTLAIYSPYRFHLNMPTTTPTCLESFTVVHPEFWTQLSHHPNSWARHDSLADSLPSDDISGSIRKPSRVGDGTSFGQRKLTGRSALKGLIFTASS